MFAPAVDRGKQRELELRRKQLEENKTQAAHRQEDGKAKLRRRYDLSEIFADKHVAPKGHRRDSEDGVDSSDEWGFSYHDNSSYRYQ